MFVRHALVGVGVGVGMFCASAHGALGDELAKMLASDGVSSDEFGYSVAISGDLAIIGAPNDDDDGTNSGSAYIFDISDPENPTQESKITASDAAAQDFFGWSVAIDGDIAIVGAHSDDDGGNQSGSAYIFDVSDPANPSEESKLAASDAALGDFFGWSVAVDGDIAMVGAVGNDDGGTDSGSAYVFDISDPANPTQESKIVASDDATGDFFGWAIALNSDYAVISAHGDNDNGTNAGSVYLFDVSDPSNPDEKSELLASDGAAEDRFGHSVAIDGDFVIIGSPNDDFDIYTNAGSAYIFDISTPSNPSEESKVIASDEGSTDYFGSSVALTGEVAVVGARGNGNGTGYIFDLLDPSSPIEAERFVAGATTGDLGFSMAAKDGVALVGAPGDNSSEGAAFTFNTTFCEGDVNYSGTVDASDISYVVFRLGTSGPEGDANRDGTVDANDTSYVIFRLGNTCP